MKVSAVLALFTVCVPIVAHAQTADTPDVAALPMAPPSVATSDAFVWRFAPPVGSRWRMRSFTRTVSRSYNPISDGSVPHEMESIGIRKLTADYDVLSRDSLGATTIRLTLRTMMSDTTVNADGANTKYWLADPNSVNGTTLTVKQSREGKIWSVIGLRTFQRKILETDSFGDVTMIDTMLDSDPITGSSDMVKSLSRIVGILPTSPIRVGEGWLYNMNLLPSLSPEVSGTRTIKSLDSQVAVVVDSVTYKGELTRIKPVTLPPSSKRAVNFTHVKGSINSVSRVQRSSGLPLESTTSQTVKGGFLRQISTVDGFPTQYESVPFNVRYSTRTVFELR